jgi:hypothetical protein
LLLPIDHSLNIIPHVMEPLDSDGFPCLPKAGASPHAGDMPREQHLDLRIQDHLRLTPGGHPQSTAGLVGDHQHVRQSPPIWVDDLCADQQSFCEEYYVQHRKWPTKIYVDTNYPDPQDTDSGAYRVSRTLFTPSWIRQLPQLHRSHCNHYQQEHGHWPTKKYAYANLIRPWSGNSDNSTHSSPSQCLQEDPAPTPCAPSSKVHTGRTRRPLTNHSRHRQPIKYERGTNTEPAKKVKSPLNLTRTHMHFRTTPTVKKEFPTHTPHPQVPNRHPPVWVQTCPPYIAAQCRQHFEIYGQWPDQGNIQPAL